LASSHIELDTKILLCEFIQINTVVSIRVSFSNQIVHLIVILIKLGSLKGGLHLIKA